MPTVGTLLEVEENSPLGKRLELECADGLYVHGPGGEVCNLNGGVFNLVAEREIPRLEAAAGWENVANLKWFSHPYEFALGSGALLDANDLLRWLSDNSRWKIDDGGFYLADVMRIDKIEGQPKCAALFGEEGQKQLEDAASTLFGERLRLHGPIAAHRLRAQQTIGIHSDTPTEGGETHRIVVCLGENWQLDQGGHFLLLKEQRPQAVKLIIPHTNNLLLAFRLWKGSFHAVTTVRAGQRFSLVISFQPDSEAENNI